jgi:sortase A
MTAAVSTLLRAIERVMLLVAMVALGYYAGTQVAVERSQSAWASELERMTSAPPARATMVPGALVGRIDVPRVRVSAIVREGVDADTLRSAVGHIPSTSLPGRRGNSALAGHRDSFFRGLEDVMTGDRIDVTTTEGRYRYVVRDARVVAPEDVSVLRPTDEPTLTLVTCYPFRYIGPAPQRYIVRATLAESSD